MFYNVFLFLGRTFLSIGLIALALFLMLPSATFLYLTPKLPDAHALKNTKLQTPASIYTQDGQLIAQFGDKYRTPIRYAQVPDLFVKALLAAEDDRFFQHTGVDPESLARATLELIEHGSIQSGGSTITMQVARNYLLSSEKTFLRKFNEILLAFRIEQLLNKEEIFELYLNVIYMGNRSYGAEAAAQRYYDKHLTELSLAEYALLAGLPKSPSTHNPIANPEASLDRRNWILKRMLNLGYISPKEFNQAKQEKNNTKPPAKIIADSNFYVAEMARDYLIKNYGADAINKGWQIYTTVDSTLQKDAHLAVIKGLLAYDERHPYRGPENNILNAKFNKSINDQLIKNSLKNYYSTNNLEPAVVLDFSNKNITAILKTNEIINIHKKNWPWKNIVLKSGDLIRVRQKNKEWHLTQLPKAESALICLNTQNGGIKALVGGFSANDSRFNRATQALRQAGSGFKPFIYSAAIDAGFSPNSIVNDQPLEINDGYGKIWRPQNSDKKFMGNITLRKALAKSRNTVSIQLLQKISIPSSIEYLARFGFNKQDLPQHLSLALGTASLSPLAIAEGYAVFANGGYKIEPYWVEKIVDLENKEIYVAQPLTVNPLSLTHTKKAPRVLNERTAFLMNSLLMDVIQQGTATQAKIMNRKDIAGKTGTTNEQKDNWFTGFNNDLVTTVWVGFDQPASLGEKEFGATTALPIWIDFMSHALKNLPEKTLYPPAGLSFAKIDARTGQLTHSRDINAVLEIFRSEDLLKLQQSAVVIPQITSTVPDQPPSSTDD